MAQQVKYKYHKLFMLFFIIDPFQSGLSPLFGVLQAQIKLDTKNNEYTNIAKIEPGTNIKIERILSIFELQYHQ